MDLSPEIHPACPALSISGWVHQQPEKATYLPALRCGIQGLPQSSPSVLFLIEIKMMVAMVVDVRQVPALGGQLTQLSLIHSSDDSPMGCQLSSSL